MAWTDAQQAAIERAQQALAGQDDWTDEQRAAIERARSRVSGPKQPEQDTPGVLGAIGNATVRMGGRAVGLADAYQAEQLSRVADAQEEMARREAAGEMTWLDRIATWRPSWAAPLETPEELRGLAADRVQSQSSRDQYLAQQFPMSAAGQRGVDALLQAKTWGEAGRAVVNQPLDVLAGAVEVGLEQAPTITAAALATIATKNPNVGMAIMGLSTYTQERFGQMASVAQEFGYDLTDPVDAQRAVNDKAFMDEQESRGMTRGAIIAAIDAVTFRAGGALFGNTAKGHLANAGLQMLSGSGGEAAAQYASTGEVSAPGEVIMEGLAEGPFSAVELSMARKGKSAGTPAPTGTELDAELASENAQLQAQRDKETQDNLASQDLEARNTRLDYAPTFVSERDFNARQEETLRADAVNPDTETGKAFRQFLLNNDILPTNQQEQTTALNAFVKETQKARDPELARSEYRTALDDHIGRMRDLETVLNPNPAAEQQLEMNFDAPKADASAEATAAPAPQGEQQLELDIPQPALKEPAVAEGAVRAYQGKDNTFTTTRPDAATNYVDVPSTDARAGEEQFTLTAEELDQLGGIKTLPVQQDEKAQALDPVRMVTEIIRATGVQVDANAEAAIAAQMEQVSSLPAEQRVAAARALVAQYTSPKAKATAKGAVTKNEAAAPKAAARNDVAKVPPAITMDTPVRRRQEGQAKADALLPANWTEDTRYDAVNSALNGKNFSIKKFNDAMAAAMSPQKTEEPSVAPDAAPQPGPASPLDDARRAVIEEANRRLGANWEKTHPDIMEMIGRDRLKSASDRIAEVAPVEGAPAKADNLPAAPQDTAMDLPSVVKDAKLSDNETKVFNALMQAFQNNEQDAVVQADGTWNTAEIGKRAGVGAKAANTYISRAVNKIAKSVGATPDQMRARLREVGIARRQGEAAPDINAPVSVFDTASLADGGSINTKASANQGARDGMSKEDAKYLDEKIANEPNPVADKRAADAAAKRESIVNEAINRSGRKALALWQTLTNDSGAKVPASKLSKADLTDWVLTVDEFEHGAITEDQVLEDHRAIERLYDATGGITQESVDEITKADEGRADQGGKTSGESSTAPEGDQGQRGAAEPDRGARAGKPPRQSTIEDAEILSESDSGRRADTRSPRTRSQQARAVAQEISDADPTPKELRNQRSFKESYAAKEGASSGLWENPNLKEAAQLADWLGGLTQEQWDAINPSFSNALNPFKNPANIDFQEAKAELEAAMNRPVADTGVVGEAKAAELPKIQDAKPVSVGPTTIVPKPIAEGKPLYRETSPAGLRSLLNDDAQPGYMKVFVTDNPDLALGQGTNAGVKVTFRPDSLGGEVNRKPSDGSGVGQEYVTTMTAGKAIATIEMPTADVKNVDPVARRTLAREFDVVEQGQTTRFTRKELSEVNANQPALYTGVVGEAKAAPKVEVRARKKIVRPPNGRMGLMMGTGQDVVNTASRATFDKLVADLTGDATSLRVHIFDTEADAIAAVERGEIPAVDTDAVKKAQPYGWVEADENGVTHAHFILDRIEAGDERAAFMHEVGGHIGLDGTLTAEDQAQIAGKILDWAELNDDSVESRVAQRTIQRVNFADSRGGISDGVLTSEVLAYFVEEATLEGITPESDGPLGTLVKKIYRKLLAALSKLGVDVDTLTAQDVVNMAYGSARLQLVGDIANVEAAYGGPRFGINRRGAQQNAALAERILTRSLGGARSAQVIADTKAMVRRPLAATKFLHQFIREVRDAMPAAGRWYDAMLEQEKTTNEILARGEPIIQAYREMKADRQALVNDFIGTSTFFQKWGYDPQWQGRQVKIDPIMKTKFDRLRPEEQQLVRDVFQHGENMRAELQSIAKQLGVDKKVFTLNSKLDGPYAPLKRFGDNVAVLRSQKLSDMEAQLRQNPQDKKLANDIEKLKGDGEHYVVSFFDTIGAAEKFAFENRQNYPVSDVSEKAPDTFGDRITNPEAFSKVISAIKADGKSGLDDNTRQAVTKIVEKLYYESLGEQNARISGARRLNRAGYEKDMIRSFMSHLQAQARLVAQLKHGAEVNTAFAEAKREAGTDRRRLQPTFNMIARKYNRMLSTDRGILASVQDNIAAFNTVYMLTSNIGYHLTNAVQPIISVSKLYGDFANYSGSWSALMRGYFSSRRVVDSSLFRQVGTAMTVGFVEMNNKVNIDVSKAPPKYRRLLETLQRRQLLDVGLEQDLNLEDRYDTGYETVNKAGDVFRNLTHRLYQVARYVEAHNRVASAIAAYDMAKANPQKLQRMKMTPDEYAISVVEDTQGNFSNFDAPLVIDALPKVTTQYRKFQLMMAWLYGDAARKAFKGSDKFEKAAGFRTLSALVVHATAMAGVGGIPMVSTIAPYLLAALGGDDDEPELNDLERYIREKVFPDNPEMADLVTRGVPAFFGVDMSTKLSQGDIFWPVNLRYVDTSFTNEGASSILANTVFGPTSGNFTNLWKGVGLLAEGDLAKGAELMSPRGVRSLMESYRYASEGYSLTNGDVVLDPRQIDVSSLFLNAIGLPPQEISHIKWTRGQQYELDQYFRTESGRLRDAYVEANRNRDSEKMSSIRDEWKDLQMQKDRVRPFFKNSRMAPRRQPLSDLLAAVRDQRRRETNYRDALGTR